MGGYGIVSVHSKSVKRVLSIIRQTFKEAGETDVLEKMSDALVDAGRLNVKHESATSDLTADKARYTLSDASSGIEVMKIKKVSIMSSDGDYFIIPRLLENDITKELSV